MTDHSYKLEFRKILPPTRRARLPKRFYFLRMIEKLPVRRGKMRSSREGPTRKA